MENAANSTYELVKRAILEKQIVSAVYHGFRREMCPHVLGWKSGKELALFFQFAGDSGRGLSPQGDWRCLNLHELSDVSIYKGRWRTGLGYNENLQSCVSEIDVQIL